MLLCPRRRRGVRGRGNGMGASKRRRIEPTHEWQLLLPLFEWPEQERYEQIRPLVLFDASITERAAEVGTSTSTLYRRLDHFAEEGMESLFDAPAAKRRRLPPSVRRLIVDLKAEYPAFNLNELANVVGAAFGSKPDVRSVARVLSEEPVPLKIVRNYPPLPRDRRPAGGAGGDRHVAPGRLEHQGHSRLPRGPPFDRLPGFGEVERGRVRWPGGRIPRAPTRCEEDGFSRRG